MRLGVFAAVAALCVAAQAQAEQPTRQSTAQAGEGGRVVFVCDRSAESKRSFEREHGKMTFVSAEELARAQAAKETWAAPRCITAAELQRYEAASGAPQLMRARAN